MSRDRNNQSFKNIIYYHNNDKVKPTPCVCEVLLKAVSRLFDDHLEDEDHCEDLVHIVENLEHNGGLRNGHIFNGLLSKQ